MTHNIPITVFTGFLGAGKTSIILSLLPKLPKDYKVVLLKNEYGDIEVDSQLARQSSLAAVSEILNGCLCCVMVGHMKNALLEIREKFRPDRIIIECSGSAFPATLAFQIHELEKETNCDLKLDAIVTVVDAENFTGYDDVSPTAQMQAKYSDIILINKSEHVSERALDDVIDHLNTLNDLTPKVRCKGREGVDPNLLFGLDTKLFKNTIPEPVSDESHHDEVQTVTIFRGGVAPHSHCSHEGSAHTHTLSNDTAGPTEEEVECVDQAEFEAALKLISKESVWRLKGFVRTPQGVQVLNWAFERYDLTPIEASNQLKGGSIRLTAMGERGEVKRRVRAFCDKMGACVV
ncbi:cobW-domain-containing protein [Coniophora puteana RWD-64-598 SS2]|uniref:CobW-domain-containing protein n=1 Tax=Coniophora puteana (strain RWD-64-598) TaxID=741705 RepID=A0A5M3MYC1_CONPW|nr:cobW-domain-containing protein [Coniophora puteana RWD-64-598 SS2]EIW84130.1 cobW-domain-containing protein [Coniophora puteana RWD-64-598 SS2]